MKDDEMIRLARERGRDVFVGGHSFDLLLLLADRLEQLRGPSEGAPVSPARERQIRDHHERAMPGGEVCPSLAGYQPESREAFLGRRDLLCLLDHERGLRTFAECALQDALAEDGRFDAGVKAGMARSLAAVRSVRDQVKRFSASGGFRNSMILAFGTDDFWHAVELGVEAVLEGATLPPHEATCARLRELEEAVGAGSMVRGGAK